MLFETGISAGAQFSPDRVYRYALWRTWDEDKGHAMFIGLNPSTADETLNDPTVRRCIEFSKRWGYGGMYMMNLFGFRSTDPNGLLTIADPVGPENNAYLKMYGQSAGVIVAAWGAFKIAEKRGELVETLLSDIHPFYCLGTTQSGAPRHPLYVPYSNKIARWNNV